MGPEVAIGAVADFTRTIESDGEDLRGELDCHTPLAMPGLSMLSTLSLVPHNSLEVGSGSSGMSGDSRVR